MLPFRVRRREMRASRRMAIRLAIFLALVIGATFAYWQWQVHEALEAARVDPTSIEACEDLDETNALAEAGAEEAQGVNQADVQARLDACEEEGFDPESE